MAMAERLQLCCAARLCHPLEMAAESKARMLRKIERNEDASSIVLNVS